MSKKIIAMIAETIPLVSAVGSYLLIVSKFDSDLIRQVISISFLLAFLGFAFFFIGRKLAAEDRAVRILGLFDWLATLYVIVIYIIAIFGFGL